METPGSAVHRESCAAECLRGMPVHWQPNLEMAVRRGGPARIGPDQVKRANNGALLASRAVTRSLGERMAERSGLRAFLLIDKKTTTDRAAGSAALSSSRC